MPKVIPGKGINGFKDQFQVCAWLCAEACCSVGVSFIPLVMESLGGWSDEAVDTISSIGRPMGQRLGISPVESTRHLFQRCAIYLCRGNAALWIHRCPIRAPCVMTINFLFCICAVCVCVFSYMYCPCCFVFIFCSHGFSSMYYPCY